MDDQLLFEQFHSAYDVEPRAGSFELLRATLMRTGVRPKRRVWLGFQLPRTSARLLAAAVLVALALASAGAFIAINQNVHQTISAQPHRSTPYTIPSPPLAASGCSSSPRQWASYPAHPAKMLSTKTGWAYGPMRTTDGGASWIDVSPPSVPNRTPKNDEFFLDATHAWVAETASSSRACVAEVVTFRTADGGLTWQKAAPIPVRYADPSEVIWTGAANHASWFDFIDAQTGWLLIGSGAAIVAGNPSWDGVQWSVGDLYRTTDGGVHWALAAANPGLSAGCIPAALNGRLHESAMSFSSPTTGWMVATCGQAPLRELLVTRDAGRSWATSATPRVPGEAPVFFDQKRGLILGSGGDLLLTSDGGASWSIRAAPADLEPIEFISPSEGWAAGPGDNGPFQCSPSDLAPCNGNFRLFRTTDGGKTWVPGSTTSLLLPAPKYWTPAYLHFVDSNTGFLDPGGPVEGFFRTTDGGHTWAAVNGTVQGG